MRTKLAVEARWTWLAAGQSELISDSAASLQGFYAPRVFDAECEVVALRIAAHVDRYSQCRQGAEEVLPVPSAIRQDSGEGLLV